MNKRVLAGQVLEMSFQAAEAHVDPFNQLEVDVLFRAPDGAEQRVPAFWGGGALWRVRFSSDRPGHYHFVTTCNLDDAGLAGQSGAVEVLPAPDEELNPLRAHGAVRVRADRAGFEHADGTPFFWLGDTWWLALGGRLGWPEDFQRLIADRRQKGFSVAHMVAGLYPDMPVDDPRNGNLGGPSWEAGFARINPGFYDQADLKLQYLVEQGIVPLIVGCWGYYLPVMGMEKMKRHWRHLVARWGAYPLVWCLAGEVSMPYYLTNDRVGDVRLQREGWSELGHYVRSIDPYHRPLTAHTCAFSASERELSDAGCLDFNFPQTAHGNMQAALDAARHIRGVCEQTALRPVVNSETCYEGILGTAWQDVQRFCFWSSILSGAVGYSYGANGIWQINRQGDPYGPSPHGMTWGNLPWDEAMRLPGSAQLGLGAGLLRELPFERLRPHPEWVEPHAGEANWFQPYCAGIPGELALVYFPFPLAPWVQPKPRLLGLAAGVEYRAFYFDPASGERQDLGSARAGADGAWEIPAPTLGADMVLVVRR
jgi:hypothetical protein